MGLLKIAIIWTVKLVVVVFLMLLIAGGVYARSRINIHVAVVKTGLPGDQNLL